MGHVFGNSSHKSSGFETTVWVIKLAFITVGVVTSLILFRISVIPSVSSFLISTLPCIWSFLRSFLSPPYIYILLNFIILAIAFSSSFQHRQHPKNSQKIKTLSQNDEYEAHDDPHHREQSQELAIQREDEEEKQTVLEPLKDVMTFVSDVTFPGKSGGMSRESSREEKQVIFWGKAGGISRESSVEEKQVTFHGKAGGISRESSVEEKQGTFQGKAGGISRENSTEEKQVMVIEPPGSGHPEKPEDPDDTLDSIWKSIMEGQGKRPQLKKCESWDTPPQRGRADPHTEEPDDPVVWAKREMRKSDTFKENVSLKREKLLSQDELNLRADAFIKKFNLDMKLEREESHLRYIQTVNQAR